MRKGWRGQCRLVCAGEAEALDVRGVVEGFANLGFLVAIRVGGECCAGGGSRPNAVSRHLVPNR